MDTHFLQLTDLDYLWMIQLKKHAAMNMRCMFYVILYKPASLLSSVSLSDECIQAFKVSLFVMSLCRQAYNKENRKGLLLFLLMLTMSK